MTTYLLDNLNLIDKTTSVVCEGDVSGDGVLIQRFSISLEAKANSDYYISKIQEIALGIARRHNTAENVIAEVMAALEGRTIVL